MCKTKVPIYMNLERKFYQNIKFASAHVASLVKDIEIDMDDNILGRALRMSSEWMKDDASKENRARGLH